MNSCINCNKSIKTNRKFCCQSCSASFNNKGIRRHKPPSILFCIECNNQIITINRKYADKNRKFCSIVCHHNYRKSFKKDKILNNELVHWDSIKKYLVEINNTCQKCGISSIWNSEPLTLQCDHIDGDKSNNRLSNARLLCPNCHTQTPTYGSKKRTKSIQNKHSTPDRT